MKHKVWWFGIVVSLLIVSFSDVPLAAQEDGSVPSPRFYHALAYDVESDRVILFGGSTNFPSSSNILSDTWAYAVNTEIWTEMSPIEAPIGWNVMDYDIQSDRVILFTGAGDEFETVRETWTYDFNTDTWTNMKPETSPPALTGARMVYDSESDCMILFGGTDATAVDWTSISSLADYPFETDTWAYNFDTNNWTRMSPATSPPGANYFSMAYDSNADRVVVVGLIGEEHYDKTWLYDYNTDSWEMRETTESPTVRTPSAMVYATGVDRTILFGGGILDPFAGQFDVLAGTWVYDYRANTWSEVSPEVGPSKRILHAMAYSSAADRVMLFGGGLDSDHATAETWLYDPSTNSWTQVGP
jgi:hypothetical protein